MKFWYFRLVLPFSQRNFVDMRRFAIYYGISLINEKNMNRFKKESGILFLITITIIVFVAVIIQIFSRIKRFSTATRFILWRKWIDRQCIYYFLKFKADIIQWYSGPDNSLRGGQLRCKHLHAIEFVIRLGTLGDIEKLPTEIKVRKALMTKATAIVVPTTKSSIS